MNFPSPTASCFGCERLVSAGLLEPVRAGEAGPEWRMCLACLVTLQRRSSVPSAYSLPIQRLASRTLSEPCQTSQDAQCRTLGRLVVREAAKAMGAISGGEVAR